MQFDRDYQKEVIAKFQSGRFMGDVGYLLHSSMFDEDLRDCVKECLSLHHRTKKTLSGSQLKQISLKHGVSLKRPTVGNHHFDRETVLDFARFRTLRDAGVKFHDLLEKGKFDRAKALIADTRMPMLVGDEAPDILTTDLPMTRRENIVGTGLVDLDDSLKGGVGAGNLAIVLAPTSGGKTSFLCFVGSCAAAAGKKVYHVSLEIDVGEVTAKYRCCLMGEHQPEGIVALRALKARWKACKKKIARKKGRIQVRHYAQGELSTTELEAELPDDTDLLIVDYLDYLRPADGGLGVGYIDLGRLSVGLRRIGDKRRIPVWTASQINRAAYEKDVADVEDVEASIQKMQSCTQALSLNQGKEQKKVDMKTGKSHGVLAVIKNTYGERGAQYEMEVNWGQCSFSLGDRLQ